MEPASVSPAVVHALLILLLLVAINAAPILAKRLLAGRAAWSLDGGLRFIDGRPLFGRSKTLRGLLAATVAGAVLAPIADLTIVTGAGLAAGSMLGDLGSSFIKRRLGLGPSTRAPLLDQLPEALLPLLLLRERLALGWIDVTGISVGFVAIDVLLSRLAYRAGVRDQPH